MKGGFLDDSPAEQRCLFLLCEILESLCPREEPEESMPHDAPYADSDDAPLDPATEALIEMFLREPVRSTEDLLRLPGPAVWN